MAQKLTLDLKEYLDDQFKAVNEKSTEKFSDVNERLDGIDKKMAELKKNMESSNSRINRTFLALAVIFIILFVHLGGSELEILKMINFL